MRYEMTDRTRTIAFALACMLSLCTLFALVPSAHAASTGATTFTVAADADAIEVTVPLTVALTVGGDGTFITPTNYSITNNSVFGIHVASVQATQSTDMNLTTNTAFSAATQSNAFKLALTPNDGTALDLGTCTSAVAPTRGQWDMSQEPAAGTGNELALAITGAMRNLNSDFTNTSNLVAVTYTFAPGAAA